MPVIDGDFVPRSPLTPAELHVDFAAHNEHLVHRRAAVEAVALPAARRIGVTTAQMHGIPAQKPITQLEQALARSLSTTARFGYQHAIEEITRLRARDGHTVTAAWVVPDAGRYARLAARGLAGVTTLVARRSLEAARAVAQAGADAARDAAAEGADVLLAATTATRRTLHLHVLELVGETLNMGRTAGALSLPSIPEFAMRSEQLDTNTCDPCDELHGRIVTVGSAEYWAILPPSGCLGGGRCRGIMVFGDGPRHVRQPESLAA